MEIGKTLRGFSIATFIDRYDAKCSIQKSSLATENAIWLGVDDAEPRIMARDAFALGRVDILKPMSDPERMNGWVSYPLPDGVRMTTRMHLTQEMVRDLLPLLIRFAETGDLEDAT